MAGHKEVVIALLGIGVAHQSALGSDRAKTGKAAGNELMRINLVAGVPDEAVVAKVKDAVQRDAKFHHSKIRCEVRRPRSGNFAQGPAHFSSQLLQLVDGEPGQIAGRQNRWQNIGHEIFFKTLKGMPVRDASANDRELRSNVLGTPVCWPIRLNRR